MRRQPEATKKFLWQPGDLVLLSQGSNTPFSEPHEAGQRLRPNPSRWDRFANQYQRDLVEVYDKWSAETQRLLALQREDGASTTAITRSLNARLNDLEVDMMTLGRSRIFEGGKLGLGDRFENRIKTASVRLTIARLQQRNDRFLAESLIPNIRQGLSGSLTEAEAGAFREAFAKASGPLRSRVAGYSGGATVAIFETQKRAGQDENAERRARGELPIAVRWVLDPQAEHCRDDPARGTFGCPSLAVMYPAGFDSLPTVPAGNVSCLGNCRCRLEMDDGSGWRSP